MTPTKTAMEWLSDNRELCSHFTVREIAAGLGVKEKTLRAYLAILKLKTKRLRTRGIVTGPWTISPPVIEDGDGK